MIFHGPCPEVVIPDVDFATFAFASDAMATKSAVIDAPRPRSPRELAYGGAGGRVWIVRARLW